VCIACDPNREVSLRELERRPDRHKGRLVTLQACYHNGLEGALLQPCEEPRPEEVAWIVSRSQIENTAKEVPGYAFGPLKYERPSSEEEALARQLSRLPDGAFVQVRLRGEFEASPKATYGIAPGYLYQVVVHRVLSVTPIASPR